MSGDEKLIQELLAKAERDLGLWHQATGCRTGDGELCLRAMAVDLSGGDWAGKPGEDLCEWVNADEDDDETKVRRIIHAHDRADRVIGASLRDPWTLAKLRRLLTR